MIAILYIQLFIHTYRYIIVYLLTEFYVHPGKSYLGIAIKLKDKKRFRTDVIFPLDSALK
jgi:hypothetical protein